MKNHGFTLLELLITFVLISILSMISYQSHNTYVTRTRRTHIKIVLLDLAVQMEEYYNVKNSYSGISLEKLNLDNSKYKGYYKIIIKSKNDSYTLSAVPLGIQNKEDGLCGTLSIDQDGNKYISGGATNYECWN